MKAFNLENPLVVFPAAVAAMLVAWQTIWKRCLVPLGHAVLNINRLVETSTALLDVAPVLVEIADEFRPNGGSTLRDSVDRIEGKVDDAATLVKAATDNWAGDRDAVMNRLAVLEDRQRSIITGVTGALTGAKDFPDVIAGIVAALGGEQLS